MILEQLHHVLRKLGLFKQPEHVDDTITRVSALLDRADYHGTAHTVLELGAYTVRIEVSK